MLRVTYTGGDAPQLFLFDPDEVDVEDAERIESAIRADWDTFLESLMRSSARTRRVLLWHLLRKANPGYDMPFEDSPKFKMGQLKVELGTVELDRLISLIANDDTLTDARKSAALGPLLEARTEAETAEQETDADEVTADPKEPATERAAVIASGSHVTEGVPEETLPEESVPHETPTLPSSPTS